MVDIRFKSKKIKDEKAYKLRIAEIKRYLESFPSAKRNEAQNVMSLIYQTKQQENRYAYFSFFSLAIAVAIFSFGYWQTLAGKSVIVATVCLFLFLVYKIILAAYRVEQLKRILGELKKRD